MGFLETVPIFFLFRDLLDPEVLPAQQGMLSIANRKSFLVQSDQLNQRKMLVHQVFSHMFIYSHNIYSDRCCLKMRLYFDARAAGCKTAFIFLII